MPPSTSPPSTTPPSESPPSLSADSHPARLELVALAQRYHQAGWMLGTSGNLSARTGSGVVVTASGRDKGALGSEDFVEVTLDGQLLGAGPGRRPSAETSIHLAVYRQRPAVGAVLHVHTVNSTLARPDEGVPGALVFRDLEMIKGWGLWDAEAEGSLRVLPNHADVPRIAAECELLLGPAASTGSDAPTETPAMLIAGHGLTAWGATIADAHRHVEITEFLCGVWREGHRSR